MLPRRFALVRHVDYTGISGVGVVAYGVVFADGHVALRWSSDHPATSLWESLDDLIAVHGHGEATSVEWIDPTTDLFGPGVPGRTRGRRARRHRTDPTLDGVSGREAAAPHVVPPEETTTQNLFAPDVPPKETAAPAAGTPPPPPTPGHGYTLAPEPSAPSPDVRTADGRTADGRSSGPPGPSSSTPGPSSGPSGPSSGPSGTRSSLLTERATADQQEIGPRVPSQRWPGRHRRAAPERESRPTQPIESDRP